MLVTLNQALYFLTFAVSPAVMLAGWLMSPDWTSGDLFGIRPILHDLWVVISNITYFIYAILLIFIALATIFNSQNYWYKKLLPRLALGIILVPLTWWFVQFIISLSSIVTASVINIPVEVILKLEQTKSPGTETWLSKPTIPKQIIHDASFGNWSITTRIENCTPEKCLSPKQILTNSSGMFWGLMVYAYGIFRFQDNFQIDTTTDAVKVIMQLIHQGLMMSLMFLVFWLLVISLVFMLMMRAIKLWFYAIFSPLMTLKYVVWDGFFWGKENSDGFEIKEFIGLAFVPALVWLALSFGLVIIATLHMTWSSTASWTQGDCLAQWGCKVTLMWNAENTIETTLQESIEDGGPPSKFTQTIIKFWGMEYWYYWSVTWVTWGMWKMLPSALSAAWWMFGTIIIDIIALIFIWTAFMAAKNVTKVAKAAIEPFEKIWNRVGKMAMDMPKYTPIPGTGGLSIKSADKVLNNADRALDIKHEEEFKNSKYGRMFWGDRFISPDGVSRISNAIKGGKASEFSDNIRPYENKAEGHRWEHLEAFRDQMKGMSDAQKRQYLETIWAKDGALRDRIVEFTNNESKSRLASDSDRKELWDMMRATAWSTTAKWWNNTAAWFNAGRIWSSDALNVNINWSPITVKNEAWKDNIEIDATKLKEIINWQTEIISKSDFVKSLMTWNAMTSNAAEKIADAINKENSSYFKSSKSPDGGKTNTTVPPQP